MLTRRIILTGLAALPATAAPGRAQAPSDALPAIPDPQRAPAAAPATRAAERALHHWREFHLAMREVDPSVERWLVYGSEDPGEAGVRGMRVQCEPIGHGLMGDVERIVYRGSFGGGALWRAEYEA